MNIDPQLANALHQLGEIIGLGGLTLDADGAVALGFDNLPTVNLQYRPDRAALFIFADLGTPAGGPTSYEGLLRGNYFWDATLGATLSLSGDRPPHVVLARSIPLSEIDPEKLAKIVETFTNTVQDWSALISQLEADDAPSEFDDDEMTILRV